MYRLRLLRYQCYALTIARLTRWLNSNVDCAGGTQRLFAEGQCRLGATRDSRFTHRGTTNKRARGMRTRGPSRALRNRTQQKRGGGTGRDSSFTRLGKTINRYAGAACNSGNSNKRQDARFETRDMWARWGYSSLILTIRVQCFLGVCIHLGGMCIWRLVTSTSDVKM